MEKNSDQSRRKFFKTSAFFSGAFLFSPFISVHPFFDNTPYIKVNTDRELFFKSCEKGEIKAVKKTLNKSPDLLYAKNKAKQSGFTLALLNQHYKIGEYLKSKGYEPDLHESALDLDWDRFNLMLGDNEEKMASMVNKIHPMGGTAMWAAAAGGAGKNIWRVYAANSDPNIVATNRDTVSPIQKALAFQDLKRAELTAAALLSNNTDPNPEKNRGLPPLHLASSRGSLEILEMLIRLGANLQEVDEKGRTALDIASYYGQESAYEMLKNHGKIPRTCRSSRYAFTVSGEPYVRPELDEMSIHEQGSMVGSSHRNLDDVTVKLKETPMLAHAIATTSEGAVEAGAHMGNKKIVEILLKEGAPYALPTAVMMNDFKTVKKLLKEDPERIYERGAHDFALLWYTAIGERDLGMAQLLIDFGAEVEEQHFLGTTALHWSCMVGSIELVAFFIENGADVNRAGRKFGGKLSKPIELTNDDSIKKLLISKGAK